MPTDETCMVRLPRGVMTAATRCMIGERQCWPLLGRLRFSA
jgi:hypothetical protein